MDKYLYFDEDGSLIFSKTPQWYDLEFSSNNIDELKTFLDNFPSTLSLNNPQISENLYSISQYLGNKYENYIINILNLDNIEDTYVLSRWQNYFSDYPFVINKIDSIINKHNANIELNEDLEDNINLTDEIIDGFKTKNKIKNNYILSGVNINEEISSKIIMNLGTELDISDVFNNISNNVNNINYIVTEQISKIFKNISKNNIKKMLSEPQILDKLKEIVNMETYIPIKGTNFRIRNNNFEAEGDANLISQLNIGDKIMFIVNGNKIYFQVESIISSFLATVININSNINNISSIIAVIAIKYSVYADSLNKFKEIIEIYEKNMSDKNKDVLATFIIANFSSLDSKYSNTAKKFKLTSDNTLNILQNISTEENNYNKLIAKNITDEKQYRKITLNLNDLKKNLPVEAKIKTLRPWQEKAIEHIKYGNSLLITGPTGGGKTYVSMIAFNYTFDNFPKEIITYIGPNFHLALQTYANFKKTFPNQKCSFISNIITEIVPDSKVFFGTPLELSVYLESENITYNVGIFDEIHTISVSYSNDKLGNKKPEAISNLLSKCKRQIIALSATINDKDNLILRNYISERTGIDNVYRISYKTRPVKLERYIYSQESNKFPTLIKINPELFNNEETSDFIEINNTKGNKREGEEKKGREGENKKGREGEGNNERREGGENIIFPGLEVEIDNTLPEIPKDEVFTNTISITPEDTYNLLKYMEDKDMLSTIFFDTTEEDCYNNFVNYVNWIENEDYTYLHTWYKLQRELEIIVNDFNDDNKRKSAYALLMNAVAKSNSDAKYNEAMNRANPFIEKRQRILDSILTNIRSEIIKVIKEDKRNNIENKYIQKLTEKEKNEFKNEIIKNEILIDDYNYVSYNIYLCIKEYTKYRIMRQESHDIGLIQYPFYGTAPLFRIGARISAIDEFKAMINKTPSTEDKQILDNTLVLCNSENIKLSNIENIIKMIIKGLEYGVTMIIPTLPFVVQYQLIKVITEVNNRNVSREGKNIDDIKCIFASYSMGLGVNYSFRTVVIRSMEYTNLIVSSFRQLEGRGGRQGLDNRANVISINIANAAETNLSNLPRIKLPEYGEEKGCLIPDYLSLSVSIETRRIELGDINFENNSVGNNANVKVKKMYGRGVKKASQLANLMKSRTDTALSRDDVLLIGDAIKYCITPISDSIGFDENIKVGIIERVINIIESGALSKQYNDDPYLWIQRINEIKASIQELYIRFHDYECEEFLNLMKNIFKILHKIQYIQYK